MPRNGSGVYSPPSGTYAVSGTTISSSAYDTFLNDLSAEVTNSLNVQGTAPMLAALNMGSQRIVSLANPVGSQDAVTLAYALTSIIAPIGSIVIYAGVDGTSTPPGWEECNGASVSTTGTYANLFGVIGYTFGGSGANFNLPDLRGYFVRGWDHGAARDLNYASRPFGSLETSANAPHTHGVTDPGHTHTVNDSGHVHTVTDGGHTHGVTDPGHTHTVPFTSNYDVAPAAGVSTANNSAPTTSSSSTTGLTVNSATTGISVNSHTTGVTNATATTGISTQSSGANETSPLNIALLYMIKY